MIVLIIPLILSPLQAWEVLLYPPPYNILAGFKTSLRWSRASPKPSLREELAAACHF